MISINKVNTIQDEELFILIDHGDGLNIRMQILNLSRNKAYHGNISDVQLRSFAANVHMRYDVYLSETLIALGQFENQMAYNYSLEENNGKFVFQWIKLVENGAIKARMGEVNIRGVDFTTSISDILLFMCLETQKLKCKNAEIEARTKESEKNMSDSHKVLEEALKAKECLESQLFSKFALVLNSKKLKIRELHETIEDFKNACASKKMTRDITSNKKNSKQMISENDRSDAGPSNISDMECTLNFPHDDVTLQRFNKPRTRIKAKATTSVSENVYDQPKKSKPMMKGDSDKEEDIDAMLEEF